MADPVAARKKAEARNHVAVNRAFEKSIMENTHLRISIEAKDLLIGEQAAEIKRLTGKLEEAGIPVEDPPPEEEKPGAGAKPNRSTRRATGTRTRKGAKGNGKTTPEQPAQA